MSTRRPRDSTPWMERFTMAFTGLVLGGFTGALSGGILTAMVFVALRAILGDHFLRDDTGIAYGAYMLLGAGLGGLIGGIWLASALVSEGSPKRSPRHRNHAAPSSDSRSADQPPRSAADPLTPPPTP